MRTKLVLSLTLLLISSSLALADETEQYNEIRTLLSSGKLDAAEKSFASAIEASPDSARLKSLHYLFYVYLNRAGRSLDAARHAEANLDVWIGNLSKAPQMATSFSRQVDNVTATYAKLDKHDVAIQKLDETVDKVGKLLAERESAEFAALVLELRARKSLLLADAGRDEEARELLDSVRKVAEEAFATSGDDPSAALALASVLSVQAQF